ncbi:MAG: PDZ domain-containing protein, partial [Phycisphaerae bacterium]|nr:PDZ domain-containing protein [Phycisphaerae bacterium]
GIISAKGKTVPLNPSQRYIQTDAAINKGNSGGPLVNVRGEVIGINWAIRTASGGYDGIGFAIPSNVAKKVINKLIEGKDVVGGFLARGFLGVEPQDIGEQMALSLKLSDNRGAMVNRLVEGSPADKAGLKVFDFIIAVGGMQIAGEYELRQAISALKPGTKVNIEFYRKGEKQKVQVEIGQRPETVGMAPDKQEPSEEAAARFGLAVETLTAELAERYGLGESVKGALIVEVHPDSDAYEQGLREGMAITHVGWNEIDTAGQFADAVSSKDAAKGVTLRVVKSGGRSELIFITAMGE